jgi:hypothetical protein
METKKHQSNLEIRLESLKDQFISALKATRLVVNPQINGLTLTYERRRGLETKEGCKIIQPGLMIMIQNAYKGYVNISFETVDETERIYKATLELLTEKKQTEQELAYDVLTKINQFINKYNDYFKRR